ncbi:hypothetical protein Nepgr_017905 [Nepenthes gracilis]|uniref:Uncharacterized protein n=1 Tax=Nepenthes gracilis TaxID=150966 RepID=A0AAD3XTJ7_NEPGR|nr:hypothetical protein Nepgr_017905 [Nepenthes gracilis]
MEKSAIHYPRTQPSTNSTLASLNKFSIPSSPFGLIQTMASLASVLAPSALHFITVRLSDTTKISPLRDKIGGCISRNSSSVTAQISCRRLCLKGQEIALGIEKMTLSNNRVTP